LTLDTQVTTIEQAREKLKQAIDLGAHDDADYWRDWIKGYHKGELKGKKEMALGLLQAGVDVNIIAQTSGLSIEEIESLKDK
jgi:predicted transposase/invertase (TIGR01784 family)